VFNINNRITSKKWLGRKPGKRFFSVTITLSQAQIDYLKTKPNASGLIRKILDDLIASESHVEQKLGAVSMNFQLEQLYERLTALKNEREHYMHKNPEYKWQTTRREDPGYGMKHYIVWEGEGFTTPKQLDSEQGKIAWRVLQGYNEAIKVLDGQIAELKQKIISG
jgi:hypothetical protein